MSPRGTCGQSALATLHEPTPEEASRWHKARKNSPLARMKVLVDFLLEDAALRLVKRTEACAELLIDTGTGTVRLTMRPDEFDLRAGPFLVKAREPDVQPPKRHQSLVADVVEMLQIGTGYYVYSDALVGFEPSGGCPACGIEVFEWQDECEACDAKLYPPVPGEDEHDGRSRRVVEVLLRREMIELASPRGRRNVERTISAFYAYGTAGPDVLLGLFMDMADIAEVYCDEEELYQVLLRIR